MNIKQPFYIYYVHKLRIVLFTEELKLKLTIETCFKHYYNKQSDFTTELDQF